MKKILIFMASIISLLLLANNSFAENNIEDTNILKKITFEENIKIKENLNIDLTWIKSDIIKFYNSKWETNPLIEFEWNTKWEASFKWEIFNKKWENFWDKEITLNIYKKVNNENQLIYNKKIELYAYKRMSNFIFEKELWEKMTDYISKAKESGILINKLSVLNQDDIEKENILEKINANFDDNENKYINIWWDKDFLFNIISKLNKSITNQHLDKKINIVLISSFNIDILKSLLQNFISNKVWINKILLLDESSKFKIIENTENINKLEEVIKKNNYEYINLSETKEISNIFFISKFINNLSNKGFNTESIYLILIIPFLLLWVNFFKHFLWLSPIWILIPTALTLLFLKINFIAIAILLIVFLFVNLGLSKIISRYKLHYSPKISLLTIINIIFFIIAINILIANWFIEIDINDIMFMIFFILIAEKLINVIIWKEFWEYKLSLLNTLLFSLISYLIFKLTIIKTFILAYPETIILLIPILFLIGQFSWLRVTEYFRFREVIKSIEE